MNTAQESREINGTIVGVVGPASPLAAILTRFRTQPYSTVTPAPADLPKPEPPTNLARLVADSNAMLPPGFVLAARDWARLDPLQRDPAAYLTELARTVANPPEVDGPDWLTANLAKTTRQPWKSTTPLALAEDANFTRRGVTHKLPDCHATDSWRHVFGGTYCCNCWPPTDPLAVIHLNRSTP